MLPSGMPNVAAPLPRYGSVLILLPKAMASLWRQLFPHPHTSGLHITSMASSLETFVSGPSF